METFEMTKSEELRQMLLAFGIESTPEQSVLLDLANDKDISRAMKESLKSDKKFFDCL